MNRRNLLLSSGKYLVAGATVVACPSYASPTDLPSEVKENLEDKIVEQLRPYMKFEKTPQLVYYSSSNNESHLRFEGFYDEKFVKSYNDGLPINSILFPIEYSIDVEIVKTDKEQILDMDRVNRKLGKKVSSINTIIVTRRFTQ